MRRLLIAALAVVLAPAAAAAASQPILQREVPDSGGMQVTEVRVTYGPGEVGRPHHHGGFLVAYMIRGTLVSQVEGEPEHTYRAGDSWIEEPGAHHIVGRNPSATEPAEFVVVFVAPKGAVLTTPDP